MNDTPAKNPALSDFQQFMKRREEASVAFVNGDIGPLDNVSTHTSPASIFGPRGDTVEGADQVNAVNATGAQSFEQGGTSTFEIQLIAASGDVAYWAGIQRSTVKMNGKDAMPMDLRVTEAFRREGGEWKLVHRHADLLKR